MDTRHTDTLRTPILRTAIRRLPISTGRSRTEVSRPISSDHRVARVALVRYQAATDKPTLVEP